MAQLNTEKEVYFSVPSGNYGNLTAGLLAKAMGLPIAGFIASSNANEIVHKYLDSGKFEPKPSVQTISNAMDVGNPSNFGRMTELYGQSWEKIIKSIQGFSATDKQTKVAMKKVFDEYGYILDPHGAVGYLGLQHQLKEGALGVFLETAHPAKFLDTVHEVIGEVEIPQRLSDYLDKKKVSIEIRSDFSEFKEFLLD